MSEYRRYSNTSSDDELNDRCCFGVLNIFIWLPILSILNFLVDIGVACLTVQTSLLYVFGISTLFSLLCIGAVVSGVQEENKWKVRVTMFWLGIKLLVLSVILAAVGISIYDHQFVVDILHFDLDPSINWVLIVAICVQIFFVFLQFELSGRAVKLIAIRDKLYVIPTVEPPKDWRSSLSVHLEKLDKLEKLRAQRPSLATVLPVHEY